MKSVRRRSGGLVLPYSPLFPLETMDMTASPLRSPSELAQELEKVLQDREQSTANAAQWEMVSLPLLQEIALVLRSGSQSLPEQYWNHRGQLMEMDERARQGEDVEEEREELLSQMDKLWDSMDETQLDAVRKRQHASQQWSIEAEKRRQARGNGPAR